MKLIVALVLLLATSTARADDAIAVGEGGVRVGADVVFAKPVHAAAYDAALDLVWVNTKGTLQVIDLRVTPPRATVIAKKMPEGGFDITGGSTASSGTAYSQVFPVLNTTKAKFTAVEGVYGELDIDPDGEKVARKAIKKIKVVGKAWLKKLKKRTKRALPPPPAASTIGHVQLPAGVGNCEDEGTCGETRAFGTTPYVLVTLEYSCGDACFEACGLYDPKTKKLASPTETNAWGQTATPGACEGYEFSADGKTYLSGTARCTFAKGITCQAEEAWGYLGWAAPPAPAP